MALEQDLTPSETKIAPITGIDNEIAAYRAIRPSAVISLICGLLAIFCFTSLYFLAFTIAAIILGLRAERAIARDPEIWTGRKMAQAGLALGLIFGLAATTSTVMQDLLRRNAIKRFGAQYAEILKKGSIEEAAYYTASPLAREGKKPNEVYKEIMSHTEPAGLPDEQLDAIRAIKTRLASNPAETIAFEELESSGIDGLIPYGTVLFKLRGPGTKDYPDKEQLAAVNVKGVKTKGKSQWWIESSKYPVDKSSK